MNEICFLHYKNILLDGVEVIIKIGRSPAIILYLKFEIRTRKEKCVISWKYIHWDTRYDNLLLRKILCNYENFLNHHNIRPISKYYLYVGSSRYAENSV